MDGEVPFSHYAEVNPKRLLTRGHEYPFVEMAGLPEGGGRIRHIGKRLFDGQGSRFAVGDTLFARITPCTENGKTSIVRELNGHQVGFGSTEFIVLAARSGVSHPEFIYQVAVWEEVRRRAVSRMLGTSGRQRVPTWFFEEELHIPQFSLQEQRFIARTLDAIDEAIEKTEAVIAATEQVRKALLQELLTRGVPGWHTEWKTVPGIGTIPACWEVVRLGEVLLEIEAGWSPNCESRPAREDEWGVLKVSSVTSGRFRPEENKALPPHLAPRLELEVHSGDVLVGRASGNPELVGRAVFVESTRPRLLLCDKTLRLCPNPGRIGNRFLSLLIEAEGTRAQLLGSFAGGDGWMGNVSQEALKRLWVAIPAVPEQRQIERAAQALNVALAKEEDLLIVARSFKSEVAEALLSGRVRVPVSEEVMA